MEFITLSGNNSVELPPEYQAESNPKERADLTEKVK
jgi:hypothetical protein